MPGKSEKDWVEKRGLCGDKVARFQKVGLGCQKC